MHPLMQNVPPRYHAEISKLETKPVSKLSRIHLQLAIINYGNGRATAMCVPNSDLYADEMTDIGTICCNQGNCNVNCLLYYSTRFGKALKLLEELQNVIEITNVVPEDAPKPCE